jgi:hypothetical protein
MTAPLLIHSCGGTSALTGPEIVLGLLSPDDRKVYPASLGLDERARRCFAPHSGLEISSFLLTREEPTLMACAICCASSDPTRFCRQAIVPRTESGYQSWVEELASSHEADACVAQDAQT